MITVWVVRFLAGILDQSLVLIPPPWRPEALFGRYIPGLGIILSLLLLLVTGVLVKNLFGRQMVQGFENLVRRIPVVGQIYGGAKTFSETVLADKGRSFKQVVLVRFPHPGVYSIGFITSEELEEVQARTAEDVTCVLVPTTPNPTTGFLILVPKKDVIYLDMSVDEAVKMVLTLGVVVPTWKAPARRRPPCTAADRPVTSRLFFASPGPGHRHPAPVTMPMRTHYCGEVDESLVGRTVSVAGWVNRRRDHGGVIFVDLRDREGLLQVVFDPSEAAVFAEAERLRGEWVIRVSGSIRPRPEGTANPNLKSGAVELLAREIEVLNRSEALPFQLDEDVKEEIRLKYRYLDLRRDVMQQRLRLRHAVTRAMREYLDGHGFVDLETPMLTKATPEGARDYLVPSRTQPGRFFALPQSPQIFKQLLMMSGFDRYYQIVRCFRDEDLRADRQPEFTQLDVETSFLGRDEIMGLMEGLVRHLFRAVLDVSLPEPFPRMTYAEAMRRYGSDKPDLRVPLELVDVGDLVRDSEFKVFAGPATVGRRPGGGATRARGWREALAQADRRLHGLRRALRRQGSRLRQGQRRGARPRRAAVADPQVPVGRRDRGNSRAHRRAHRGPGVLRRGPRQGRQRRARGAAAQARTRARARRARLAPALGDRFPDVRMGRAGASAGPRCIIRSPRR